MTRRKQPRGKCAYCGKEFAKGGMLGHLPACRRRKEIVAASDRKSGAKVGMTHLRVTDYWRRDFWLDLEMQGLATLQDLDRYLRRIWLECCGHLSMFSTGSWGDLSEIPMTTRIDQALQPRVELVHIYDFGTSSETIVRTVAVRDGMLTTSHSIALMSRNNMPNFMCMECDSPAVGICMGCMFEDGTEGTMCKRHSEIHIHIDDYGDPLPLINSPRIGMCGYDGPAEPLY